MSLQWRLLNDELEFIHCLRRSSALNVVSLTLELIMEKGQNSLLTIPKQDDDTFLLVQLPDSLPIEELLRQTASIVGHKSNAQACLVTDAKSFALSRVETSNALVLVPPTATSSGEPPAKKIKVTNTGTELVQTPCRWLGAESGAYFLELKERQVDLKALEGLLSTFDPYSNETSEFKGVSLEKLALELQVSKAQVKAGLTTLHALEFESMYSLLSEEAWQEARRAILAALTECDEFSNYAQSGVDRQAMIQESVKRVTESYPQLEAVFELVLRIMTKGGNGENITIDFEKVAIFVAHELFAKPSWLHDDLVKEWQARVPGVGDAYQLDVEKTLRGVAIRSTDENEWMYLPADKLTKSPSERMAQLFASREKWTQKELEPYLAPLSNKMDEILVKHALAVTEQIDGETISRYVKKEATV
mmetsp:Transcript_10732/g.17784  ORF Transcript_10732/g.17784 Transcript_10732/m.17784 type:complete len:419 (-) Transcript_10732:991-2247(-)